MNLSGLVLFGLAIGLGCLTPQTKDSGGAEADTDTDADADTDTDTEVLSITGEFRIVTSDFESSIGLWSLSGTSTSCSNCLYAFDGTFSLTKGSGDDFTRKVTITDTGETYKGYSIGLVYADNDMWGYAYDESNKGYTYVSNYSLYTNGSTIPYGYIGYWYR